MHHRTERPQHPQTIHWKRLLLSQLVATGIQIGLQRFSKGRKTIVKTKRAIIAGAVALSVILAFTPGCRPDDSIPDDNDSTSVIIDETPDSISGVWDADTLSSTTDLLTVHQENLEDVFFSYDSEELSQEALDVLMDNASYIMDNEGFRVLIEGHCDERGTIDYNLALGEKRAMAVYDYLKNYGVDPERLEFVSYGKERPFDPGQNERAWASNRRAHFRVLPGN
ncbi:MAG: peptidoglycan-associated lipoprotein Pal [Candidatus Aegiribacteria sp.]|nr:peptidoglycan-associated lipoprotein Pal [Candidatus Aegiribacteria sp.]MBD3294180.1 peptidoglycan-associated lipoprotein Pal [Candidatus Fermentibacteria bacterium]